MAFAGLDSCFRRNDGVGDGILLGALRTGSTMVDAKLDFRFRGNDS